MDGHTKRVLVAVSMLLVTGGGLVGCGGGDDSDSSAASDTSSSATASSSASASSSDSASASASAGSADSDAFCQAFLDFGTALGQVDPSAAPADVVKTIKTEADKLGAVDLPSDVPADAEAGFKAIIGAIDGLPDNATLDDVSGLENDLTAEQKQDATAFNTYLEQECPQLAGDTSSSSASPVTPAPSASAS